MAASKDWLLDTDMNSQQTRQWARDTCEPKLDQMPSWTGFRGRCIESHPDLWRCCQLLAAGKETDFSKSVSPGKLTMMQ